MPLVSATGSARAWATRWRRSWRGRLRPRAPRAWRQQRGDRGADRRPRSGAARDRCSAAVGTAGQRCTSLRRLIVHESVYDALVARLRQRLCQPADRLAAGGRHAGRPADRPRMRSTAWKRRSTARKRRRRRWSMAAARALADRFPDAVYVRPALGRDAGADRTGPRGDLRADPLRAALFAISTRRIALHNDVPQGLASCDLHQRRARGRDVRLGARLATAASPTSISARPAPRSAARSAARRRPAAAASPARTPGRPTCAARPTRSTTRRDLPLAQGITFDAAPPRAG